MENGYLEGNYDNGKEEKQAEADAYRAENIRKQAEEIEKEKREELVSTARHAGISNDAGIVYNAYGEDENKYLVDGAVLTCNRATMDVKIIRGVAFGTGVSKSGTKTMLSIPFSESINTGRYVATVKDYKIGENIKPFECNCQLLPDRDSEVEEIFSELEICRKSGTCQKLMRLENRWENMIRETEYFSYTAGGEEVEGLTMMSMLFCSHGGLITPVTSGQESALWYVHAVPTEAGDKLSEFQKKQNAVYIYNYLIKRGVERTGSMWSAWKYSRGM